LLLDRERVTDDLLCVCRSRLTLLLFLVDEELLLLRVREPVLLFLDGGRVIVRLLLELFFGEVVCERERLVVPCRVLGDVERLLVVERLRLTLLFLLFVAVLLLVVDLLFRVSYLCGLYARERLRRSIVREVVIGICLCGRCGGFLL
jgi:hypothetical protein